MHSLVPTQPLTRHVSLLLGFCLVCLGVLLATEAKATSPSALLTSTSASVDSNKASTTPPLLATNVFALSAPRTAYPEVALKPLRFWLPSFAPRLRVFRQLRPGGGREKNQPLGGEGSKSTSGEAAPTRASDEDTPTDAAAADRQVIPVEDLSRFPRVRGVQEETRVFWYASMASVLTSLVVRVLAFLPVVLGAVLIGGANVAIGPAATLALVVALVIGFSAADAGIAALSASLVFDSLSEFYDSSYIAAFAGHFLGNAAALGVTGLTAGFGLSLILGTTILTPFIGETVTIGISILTLFGLIPVIVVGFFASLGLPALIGVWSLTMSARPREGFKIDPGWIPLAPGSAQAKPPPRARRDRNVRLFGPRLVIPGT